MEKGRLWLAAGGTLSAAAALLHVAVIFGGADWYRFFGAGEDMARMAEAGSLQPHLVTLGIVAVLGLWAAYAFAGARMLPRLPLMRTALVLFTAIYMLRAVSVVPVLVVRPEAVDAFMVWSSLIVLVYAVVHAVGTWKAWSTLSRRDS